MLYDLCSDHASTVRLGAPYIRRFHLRTPNDRKHYDGRYVLLKQFWQLLDQHIGIWKRMSIGASSKELLLKKHDDTIDGAYCTIMKRGSTQS